MFVRLSAWRQALGKDGTEKGWPDSLAPAAEDAEGLAQDRSRVVFWEVSGFISSLSISSVLMLGPGGITWCSVREGSEKSNVEL